MTIAATGIAYRAVGAPPVATAAVAAAQGVGNTPDRGDGGDEIIGTAVPTGRLRDGVKAILPATKNGVAVAAGGFAEIVRQSLAAPAPGDTGVGAAPVVAVGIDAKAVLITQAAVVDKRGPVVAGVVKSDGGVVLSTALNLVGNGNLPTAALSDDGVGKAIAPGAQAGAAVALAVDEAATAAVVDDAADPKVAGFIAKASRPDGDPTTGSPAVIAPAEGLQAVAVGSSPIVPDAGPRPTEASAAVAVSNPSATPRRNAAARQREPADDAKPDAAGLPLPQLLLPVAQERLAALPVVVGDAEDAPPPTQAVALVAGRAGQAKAAKPDAAILVDGAAAGQPVAKGSADLVASPLKTRRETGDDTAMQRGVRGPPAPEAQSVAGVVARRTVAAIRSVGGNTEPITAIAEAPEAEAAADNPALMKTQPTTPTGLAPVAANAPGSPGDMIAAAASGQRTAAPREVGVPATTAVKNPVALPIVQLPETGDPAPVLAVAPQSAGSTAPSPFLLATPAIAAPVVLAPVPVSIVLPVQPEKLAHDVGVALAQRLAGNGDELRIRLEPADFGTIDIRMTFDHRGALRAVVGADSIVALDLLRRDSADLGRALSDAGVRADADSFRFESRSQDRGEGGQRQPRHDAQPAVARADTGSADIPDPTRFRPLRWNGAVDVMA